MLLTQRNGYGTLTRMQKANECVNEVQLGQVAAISTGVVFRSQTPAASERGNVRWLTIRDLVAQEHVVPYQLPLIEVAQKFEHQCLRAGDVVLPSRGAHYRAWHVPDDAERVLPVGQINIIRVQADLVSPGYLTWLINSPLTQARLQTLLTGSNIQSLTKARLQLLQIRLPAMPLQEHIARAHDAVVRAAQIRHRLNQLDQQMLAEMARAWMDTEAAHA